MELVIFKGFSKSFLQTVQFPPLVSNNYEGKLNVLSFDRDTRKHLTIALMELETADKVWITYEEYSIIKNRITDAIEDDNLTVRVCKNNIYPDYYPIPFTLSNKLASEITKALNGNDCQEISPECEKFTLIYNTLVCIDGIYYGSFYNYEYDLDSNISFDDYYTDKAEIADTLGPIDFNIFLNANIESYLSNFEQIKKCKPSAIGVHSSNSYRSKRFLDSLKTFCALRHIQLFKSQEVLAQNRELDSTLRNIAKNDIGISGFSEFRKIKFYKNPDIDKSIIEISQGQIIQEIIHQAENSYGVSNTPTFRDIFITASTGAGKSVMFQVPAIYLAKKYRKLTIVIEPVKSLMQDQKEKLNKNGYTRVEVFNSDLISQVEKEYVLQRIKNGEVDLLYLSPETLLSYSVETLIGDREIGLLIVDEAHTVTTWGTDFRPDYLYLGSYIDKLRHQVQTKKGLQRKTYQFPICAFTATAINGGIEDSVSDIIVSLYMENPIKYIGYVRRDNIKFDIKHFNAQERLSKSEYDLAKMKALNNRITLWLAKHEKTIVYFPYASQVSHAAKGTEEFSGITTDKRIGVYTGTNTDGMSQEIFNSTKHSTFESFRNGTTSIIFATKAFGLGVDVDDVQNVYHYAPDGSLCDYVQEIGRAARKASINGMAITDIFCADTKFMKQLFSMSQIKQYQIKAVLAGIYNTFKSNHESRNFLIAPETFTYIFGGNNTNDTSCINKLKICLLMIEKDLYDKYNFKVLISRPQGIFTKAFVCIKKDHESEVLNSIYGSQFKFIEKGRCQEKQSSTGNEIISDMGDIYELNLKEIWEKFNPDISFSKFKYLYFNPATSSSNPSVMEEIRPYICPRQRVSIQTRTERTLAEVRTAILEDFEFIANALYKSFGRNYFNIEDMTKLLNERFGKASAKIISHSLFDLVDPKGHCIKKRLDSSSGKYVYTLSNGNFKEQMRKPIIKSTITKKMSTIYDSSYSGYLDLDSKGTSAIALKLLSVFNYITYEVAGGKEPEIFIRLNDPNKIKNIVMGNTYYSNDYVKKAKQKHDRDIKVLLHFFNQLSTDEERWNYIEDYFLGRNIEC